MAPLIPFAALVLPGKYEKTQEEIYIVTRLCVLLIVICLVILCWYVVVVCLLLEIGGVIFVSLRILTLTIILNIVCLYAYIIPIRLLILTCDAKPQ